MHRPSHSMTGVGFAAGPSEVGELRVEVRTVNGRGVAVKIRLPGICSGFEAAIEELVREHVRRGSIAVVIERPAAVGALPDRSVLRAVASDLRQLAEELKLPPPNLADVVSAANAATRGEALTSRPLPDRLRALVATALSDLQRHRLADGNGTVEAVRNQLVEFEALCETAAARAPQLVSLYRERLLQRVQEFVQSQVPSPPAAHELVREVAIFADRIDVAEEVQRLRAHVGEIRAVLDRGGEVGRRLEFLLQELLRETNTLGSKSPDTAMAYAAVAMKSCIDRLKEQVANLE
ncbi:MAG TPA: YicC/YloC family endoribonuclease [Planctomycetota bacterium]